MAGISLYLASAHTVLPSGQSGRSEASVDSKHRWESAWGIPLLPLQSEIPSQPGSQTAHLLQHWEPGVRVNRGNPPSMSGMPHLLGDRQLTDKISGRCAETTPGPFPICYIHKWGDRAERGCGELERNRKSWHFVCTHNKGVGLSAPYLWDTTSEPRAPHFVSTGQPSPGTCLSLPHSMGLHKPLATHTGVLTSAQQTVVTEPTNSPADSVSLQHFNYISNLEFITLWSGIGNYTPTLYNTHKITHPVC